MQQSSMRGLCAKCRVLYEARQLRAHVEVCNGEAVWPGRGPKPRAAAHVDPGILPPQPQQQIAPRGTCPKCRSIYARKDLRGHVQHCTGKPAWPGKGPKPIVVAAAAPLPSVPIPAPSVVPAAIPAASASKSKGDCPGCAKHFEKGLHLHMRSCAALKAKMQALEEASARAA